MRTKSGQKGFFPTLSWPLSDGFLLLLVNIHCEGHIIDHSLASCRRSFKELFGLGLVGSASEERRERSSRWLLFGFGLAFLVAA